MYADKKRCKRRERSASAFTLIELLVVIGIIALIFAILLPTLRTARARAKAVVCAAHLHDLCTGMVNYATQFDDWIPGAPGGSGAPLAFLIPGYSPADKTVPAEAITQSWDWAGPVAVYGMGQADLPTDRAERMARLRERIFRCPSNDAVVETFHPNCAADRWGWDGPVPANSYCTIRSFMYFGWQSTNADYGELYRHNAVYYPTYFGDSARTPCGYKPTFSAIKRPSRKVLLAEGVRSVDRHGHTSDIIYYAADGGTFSAAGPCSSHSAAYVNAIGAAEPDTVPRGDESVYRHRLNSEPAINAALFDGHVEMMTKRKAIETVDLWYPSRTEVRESEFDGSAPVDSSPWALDVVPHAKPLALDAIRHRQRDASGWWAIQ